MQTSCLDRIPLNQSGTILYIDKTSKIRRRLLDLGFTKGTEVAAVFSSPSGNPKAYYIRGTVIALRNEDAAEVKIQLLGSGEGKENGTYA